MTGLRGIHIYTGWKRLLHFEEGWRIHQVNIYAQRIVTIFHFRHLEFFHNFFDRHVSTDTHFGLTDIYMKSIIMSLLLRLLLSRIRFDNRLTSFSPV